MCSGLCIQSPCFDWYAPNVSLCCCVPPRYDEEVFTMDEWVKQVLPRLHTGDIVLTSTPHYTFGTGINRCMAHTRNSHVGVVYRPSDCPEILKMRDFSFPDGVHPSRPLLAQFVGGDQVGHRERNLDNYNKKTNPEMATGGMDMVDLETYFRDYLDRYSYYKRTKADKTSPHIVGCRMLRGLNRDKQFYTDVERVLTQAKDKPFQHDAGNVKIMVDCCQCCCVCCPETCGMLSPCTAKKSKDAYICSEIVAELYVEAGLMKKGPCGMSLNPGEFVPPHFDSTRKLRLRDNLVLSPEYFVVGPESMRERSAMGYPEAQATPTYNSKHCGPGGFFNVDTAKELAPPQHSMIAI